MTRTLALGALLAAALAVPPASAQFSPSYAGLTVTRAPLSAANAGTSVQLTSTADLSPFPSFIDYPSESVSSTWLVGVGVGYRPVGASGLTWKAGAETTLLYSLVSDSGPAIDVTTGEVGAGYFLQLSPGMGVEWGAAGLVGLATGAVGTVGSADGDVYLISPDDGERYETGSEIWGTALGFGLDVGANVVLGPVTAGVGYRLATPIESWEYRVQDASDTGRSSALPSEGFASNPPSYDLNGLHLRIGVSIPLAAPAPQRPPAPTQTYIPPEPEPVATPVAVPDPEPVAAPVAQVPPPGAGRVRWVQSTLERIGYACGGADGRMGANTRACIRDYQRDLGLAVTGEADDATLDALARQQ